MDLEDNNEHNWEIFIAIILFEVAFFLTFILDSYFKM